MNAIKTENLEILNADILLGGVEYVMDSIDTRGLCEKLLSHLSVYWWIVLLSFLLTFFLSLIWTGMINLAIKPFIWTSIVNCIGILVAGFLFFLNRYSELLKVRDDIFLPQVITSMSTYWYTKHTRLLCAVIIVIVFLIILSYFVHSFALIKDAIKHIEEASTAFGSMKSILFIPILQSLVLSLLVVLFMTVANFLTSSGAPEYRVVDTCSSETCINSATEKMFALNDICDPRTFTDCTGCPRAQCVHHKFVPFILGSWLQVYNCLVMFWLLLFVQSFGCLVMAGTFADWYWVRDRSHVGVWTSFKRTCRYHLGTAITKHPND